MVSHFIGGCQVFFPADGLFAVGWCGSWFVYERWRGGKGGKLINGLSMGDG